MLFKEIIAFDSKNDTERSFLLFLLFDAEAGDSIFLRNVGELQPDYTALIQGGGSRKCGLNMGRP
jgi:hypothetical protein